MFIKNINDIKVQYLYDAYINQSSLVLRRENLFKDLGCIAGHHGLVV